MTEKKNTDYSTSAVNLTNASKVKQLLDDWRIRQHSLNEVLVDIEKALPKELKAERDLEESRLFKLSKQIRDAIDQFGSYQDIEVGEYALKQRRQTITYTPKLVREWLDKKFADLVIVEAVDSKALDGLVRGKLVDPEEAEKCGEIKETFAYVIK